VNGHITGGWFWNNIIHNRVDIAIVDVLWILIGFIGLLAFYKTQLFFKQNKIEK
jgi:hypothetical protein